MRSLAWLSLCLGLLFAIQALAFFPSRQAGGGGGGGVANTAPCLGTTASTPSADGTCLTVDSATTNTSIHLVDSAGDQWTLATRVTDLSGARILKNGTPVGAPNQLGLLMSVCNTGHICVYNGGAWYDYSNAQTQVSSLHHTGPDILPLGITGPIYHIAANTITPAVVFRNVADGVTPSVGVVMKLASLPTLGTLFDGVTAINSVGQSIPPADLATLTYVPNLNAVGREHFWITTQETSTHITLPLAIDFSVNPSPVTATNLLATFNQGDAPTVIGIGTPTNPDYAAGSLTVKFTSLPTCGTVYLNDGVTPVDYNTTYTTTQLTGTKFQPGNVGYSCSLFYGVTTPLGGYGYGNVGLKINATQIQTADGNLSVQGNAASTPIGITVPTGSGTMSNTITVLPSNGSVGCSLGCPHNPTQVGDTLTNTQLGALTFTATNGSFDKVSTIEYSTTNGTATSTGLHEIYVGGNPNLLWADPAFTCPGCSTSPPTIGSINIFPTLTQPVTAGTDIIGIRIQNTELAHFAGTIDTISGTSAVLHVNQFFQGLLATGNTIIGLTTGGTTITLGSLNSGLGLKGSAYAITCSTTCPSVATNDYMTAHGTMAAGYITFGQPFIDAHVQPGDTLVAVCESGCGTVAVKYYVQNDQKATKTDGSLAHSFLTFKLPTTIADGAAAEFMLAKCTSGCPTAPITPAATASQIANGTWTGCGTQPVCSFDVNLTFSAGITESGTTGTSAKSCLSNAIANGTVSNYFGSGAGALMNEFNVICTVDGGRLKVEYDIRAYADGTMETDTIVDNTWMWCGSSGPNCTAAGTAAYNTTAKGTLNYTLAFTQDGFTPVVADHTMAALWHHTINSTGRIFPNIQYDVPYFEATGATAFYDPTYGLSGSVPRQGLANNYSITNLIAQGDTPRTTGGTGPLSTGLIDYTMHNSGGTAPDLAPLPYWDVNWLLGQDSLNRLLMILTSDADGGHPYHFRDENINAPFGRPPNGLTYPNFWITGGGGSSPPFNGFVSDPDSTPWLGITNENTAAHMYEGNFLQYITAGPSSHWHLMLFEDQAMVFGIDSPERDTTDFSGTFNFFSMIQEERGQTRELAWDSRELAECSTYCPDTETAVKGAVLTALQGGVKANYQEYINNKVTYQWGNVGGSWQVWRRQSMATIEDSYLSTSLRVIYRQHLPKVTEYVKRLQNFHSYLAQPWLNGPNGYDNKFSTPYGYFNVAMNGDFFGVGLGGSWGAPFQGAGVMPYPPLPLSAASYTAEALDVWMAGGNGVTKSPNKFQNNSVSWDGGNGLVAVAGQASNISTTSDPLMMMAYLINFTNSSNDMGGNLGSNVYADSSHPNATGFIIAPQLPDGSFLTNDKFNLDITDNGSLVMSAVADGAAAATGNGNGNTFTGGSGAAGCTSLISTGSGTSTVNAGTCNLIAVSNCGSTKFVDNTGNNHFNGGISCWTNNPYSSYVESPNTFEFGTNSSGQDTIYGFRPGTDILRVKSTLDGNSFANAAAFTAGCSVSNGDTVCVLGGGNTITLKAVTTSLTASVTIF